MQASPERIPHLVIIITPTVVSEIAEEVEILPEDFEPTRWLEENRGDIVILATEAVKDIIYEALEIGLADHPLLLHRRNADDGEEYG